MTAIEVQLIERQKKLPTISEDEIEEKIQAARHERRSKHGG